MVKKLPDAKHQYYSWDKFRVDVRKIIIIARLRWENSQFEKGAHFDGIYGMPRGGLILAVCLSHHLKLPLLTAPTKRTLIVDDIADSGATLSRYKKNGNCVITLFKHPKSKVNPDIWIRVKKKLWIDFPWEVI